MAAPCVPNARTLNVDPVVKVLAGIALDARILVLVVPPTAISATGAARAAALAPGIVKVTPSVGAARVSVLFACSALPLATETPPYWEAQLAAVVGVATTAEKTPLVPAARIVTVLEPDD